MKLHFAIVLASIGLLMCSCKTSEQNYRNAYLTAKENSHTRLDDNTESRIEAEQNGRVATVDGSQVNVTAGYFSIVDNYVPDNFIQQPYGVVVGKFKQIFNARMLYKRLVDNGIEAYMLRDSESTYYVVVHTCASLKEAAQYIANIGSNIPFKLPEGTFAIKNVAVR